MEMNKIKVLHVLSSMGAGGVEKVIYNYYSKVDKDKFHFDFTCLIDPQGVMRKEFEDLGSTIYQLPKKRHVFKCIHALRRIIKKNHYDIVHIHLSYDSTIPLLGTLFSGCKTRIVHYHVDLIKPNLRIKISNFVNKLLSTEIFYCSKNAFYHNGFKDKKAHFYLPNVIEYENYLFGKEKREQLRKENDISDDTTVVGFIGRLSYEKNVKFLIDVANELYQLSHKYECIIVGDGFMKEELENYVKEHNISNVRFLGSKFHASDYYNAFDLLMFPSFSEGFGLVLSEAEINGLRAFVSASISKEPDFMDKATYLDLNLGPKKWAEEIHQSDIRRFNFDKSKYDKANFDVNKSVKLLEEEYVKLV